MLVHAGRGFAVSLVFAGLLVVAGVIIVARRRQAKTKRREQERLCEEARALAGSQGGLEEWALGLLKIVSSVVSGDGYYLYLRDARDAKLLVLRASMTADQPMISGRPGMAGKAHNTAGNRGYDEDVNEAPATLYVAEQPAQVLTRGRPPHEILVAPLVDSQDSVMGVIHVSPAHRSWKSKRHDGALSTCLNVLSIALIAREEHERLRRQSEETTSRVKGSVLAAASAYSPFLSLENVVRVGASVIGVRAWLVALLGWGTSTGPVFSCQGIPESVAFQAVSGLDSTQLPASLNAGGFRVLDRVAIQDMPLHRLLANSQFSRAAVFPVLVSGHVRALAVFLFNSNDEIHDRVSAILDGIANEMCRIVENLSSPRDSSSTYLESLKALVSVFDSQGSTSPGQSARVAKYAREIAEEMGMETSETADTVAAATLRDIGQVSLETGLLRDKVGDMYSDADREALRTHPSIGAAMLEPIDRDGKIAPLVLHHHERYDGFGYPGGLRGEGIPLGARIIAVADTFSALVSPRPWRPALPYSKAVETLRAAAGSQLDPAAVSALLSVFDRKRGNGERWGKALEPCWEMNQCPERIRDHCPAGLTDSNCWEIRGTLCPGGRQHSKCLVFTEYQDRLDRALRPDHLNR
ncbi:MAG: HD-GYP domain-containing protein [Bacillota bacterium]